MNLKRQPKKGCLFYLCGGLTLDLAEEFKNSEIAPEGEFQ
jgi:hypothetical protein